MTGVGPSERPTPLTVARRRPRAKPPVRRRAAVVAFDGERTLVMLRRRQGRDYAVLVGGGIEPGETAEEAAIRELQEETALVGTVIRRLPDLVDGRQMAFLVDCHGEPVLGGPEAGRSNPWNRYRPAWVPLAEIEDIGLRPRVALAVIRSAREMG